MDIGAWLRGTLRAGVSRQRHRCRGALRADPGRRQPTISTPWVSMRTLIGAIATSVSPRWNRPVRNCALLCWDGPKVGANYHGKGARRSIRLPTRSPMTPS